MYYPGKNATILRFDTDNQWGLVNFRLPSLPCLCFPAQAVSLLLPPAHQSRDVKAKEKKLRSRKGTSVETEMHSNTLQKLTTTQVSYSNRQFLFFKVEPLCYICRALKKIFLLDSQSLSLSPSLNKKCISFCYEIRTAITPVTWSYFMCLQWTAQDHRGTTYCL